MSQGLNQYPMDTNVHFVGELKELIVQSVERGKDMFLQ